MPFGISGDRLRDAARGGLAAAGGHGGDVDRSRFAESGTQPNEMQGFGTPKTQQGTGFPLSPVMIQWLSMHNPDALRRLGYRPPLPPAQKVSPPAAPQPRVNMPSVLLSDQAPGLPGYGVQTPTYAKPSGYAGTPRAVRPPSPYRY